MRYADLSESLLIQLNDPSYLNLTQLICTQCPFLTTISGPLPHLRSLDCSNCPNLTTLPDALPALRILTADNCPLLLHWPAILPSIRILWINNNKVITKLPRTQGILVSLYCQNCPRLLNDAEIRTTRTLNCSGCPLLRACPAEPLDVLIADNCRLLTSLVGRHLSNISIVNCPWLCQRLTALPSSQQISIRRWSQSRDGSAYCYAPTACGGRLAKRDLALLFYQP